jgi:hypothetical protein
MNQKHTVRGRLWWFLVIAVWLGIVGTGLGVVARYDNTAGVAASAEGSWPSGTRLQRDTSGPTLVMFAHPRCTCSRASLSELAEILARATHRPRTYVVFVSRGGLIEGPETDDLWQRASRIAGATVVRDDRGMEDRIFGAETSGQTFLYDATGRLRFSGGTTGSRGHAGDNAGRATLLAWLNNGAATRAATAVFGCSLFAPGDLVDPEEPTHEHHHD